MPEQDGGTGLPGVGPERYQPTRFGAETGGTSIAPCRSSPTDLIGALTPSLGMTRRTGVEGCMAGAGGRLGWGGGAFAGPWKYGFTGSAAFTWLRGGSVVRWSARPYSSGEAITSSMPTRIVTTPAIPARMSTERRILPPATGSPDGHSSYGGP
ncbi:hypothetical protein ACFQX6_35575 [Streptosporangium lutulentum]